MIASKNYAVSVDTKKVIIESVSIAYWLEPFDKGQEYVVPVYVFKGKSFDAYDKELSSFTGWAEAIQR